MVNVQFGLEMNTAGTVQGDWLAPLPEDKGRLFEAMLAELEVSYIILSVALHEALSFCDEGKLSLAREQATMFSQLFDRLAMRLQGVLRTLDEHGRCSGTHPRVAPLRAELFRGERAQSLLRSHALLSLVSLRRPSRFFRKLAALDELVDRLSAQAHGIVAGLAEGPASGLPQEWARLEVLHYDLNTCFCETSIVLKSFLCALPGKELPSFHKLLFSHVPATEASGSGRPARFATRIISAWGQ